LISFNGFDAKKLSYESGQLGVFIGASVLSFFELLEIIINASIDIYDSRKKKKN
jgi:hypothetical protein